MTKRQIYSFVILLIFSVLAGCRNSDEYIYNYKEPAEKVTVLNVNNLVGKGSIDLLWVIDNSASMFDYQNSVKENASLFIEAFSRATYVKWKIGMISTDVSEKPYIGLLAGTSLTASSPDVVTTFNGAVSRLGTSGDATEKTYDPIIKALTENYGFITPGGNLAIVLLSDAPEQSKLSTDEFAQALRPFMNGSLSRVLFYAIVGNQEDCKATDDPWNWKGSKFEELGNYIKVKKYPICDSNFSLNLVNIGKDIVAQVTRPSVALESRPKKGTLKVFHLGRELPPGTTDEGGFWLYQQEENAVVFETVEFLSGIKNGDVIIKYIPDDGVRIPEDKKLDVGKE